MSRSKNGRAHLTGATTTTNVNPATCRMEAIQFNAFDRSPSSRQTEISEDMRVDMEAAARAAGVSETEFARRAIEEAVARVRCECGGELPYTRHERAALARC